MNEVLELETRRKIYDLVAKNPGLHLSKVAELLKMRVSLVEYHLIYLEKYQLIYSAKESGYIRYYVKGEIATKDKKILSLMRQEIPLKIALLLLKHANLQHKEILREMGVAPSTLSYHLKKLVKHEIIEVQSYGEEKGYSIVNRETIVGLLVQYKPYNLFESFKDVWIDLTVD